MNCPNCTLNNDKVLDSRLTQIGTIKRNRKCLNCGERFTTYELHSYMLSSEQKPPRGQPRKECKTKKT